MRSIFRFRLLIVLFALFTFACQQLPSDTNTEITASGKSDAPVTTVYVIRHGEKETANPADKDPALNSEGIERAEALRALLVNKPVDALYTTNLKRTMGTLKPLAEERQLELNTYEPTAFDSLRNEVLQNYAGKTVVIAGHSNTILSIVKVFGVEPPVSEVPDSKYDHIFKITIAADNTATLESGEYGKATN